jgi:hypothetical protein
MQLNVKKANWTVAKLQGKKSSGENRFWWQPELSAVAKTEWILCWTRQNPFTSHTPIHFNIIFPLFFISGYLPVYSWPCYGTGSLLSASHHEGLGSFPGQIWDSGQSDTLKGFLWTFPVFPYQCHSNITPYWFIYHWHYVILVNDSGC